MVDITISEELAREFAYECFDEIIGDVKIAGKVSCDKPADTTFSEKFKKIREVV